MSSPMIVALFLFLVFAPCVVAFFGSGEPDSLLPNAIPTGNFRRRAHGTRIRSPQPLDASLPEAELSEEFVIRSFAKGIAQHRFVVRDTESGVKLHIAQVREAAIELMKQGGIKAARELALVVAASAAAMTSVADAVVIAATEALNAARRAYDWFAIGEANSDDRAMSDLREGPDLYGPDLYAYQQAQARQAERDRARDSGERRAASDRWRRVEPRAA